MSLIHRIGAFLGSPRGQQLIARGRRELAKPATRRKLEGLALKLRRLR